MEFLLRTPDALKSLQGILRGVKDVPRLLHRLQVTAPVSACTYPDGPSTFLLVVLTSSTTKLQRISIAEL